MKKEKKYAYYINESNEIIIMDSPNFECVQFDEEETTLYFPNRKWAKEWADLHLLGEV